MTEKVLGFKERKNDRQDHVKNWETGEIWVEKVWHVLEGELVPVVSLQALEDRINKEWKAHINNYNKKTCEWFECSNTETDATLNYAVGAEITDMEGRTIILKTKEEADAYSEKEKKKFIGCAVCDRFNDLLSWAKKADR